MQHFVAVCKVQNVVDSNKYKKFGTIGPIATKKATMLGQLLRFCSVPSLFALNHKGVFEACKKVIHH